MNPFTLIFIIVSVAGLLIAFKTADAILKYLFEKDFELWDSLNQPAGIFWKPNQDGIAKPEVNTSKLGASVAYRPNEAGKKIILRMIFKTPDWIKNSADLKSKLMIFRVLIFEWWIFCGFILFTGLKSNI